MKGENGTYSVMQSHHARRSWRGEVTRHKSLDIGLFQGFNEVDLSINL